jgi:hypothetical protein
MILEGLCVVDPGNQLGAFERVGSFMVKSVARLGAGIVDRIAGSPDMVILVYQFQNAYPGILVLPKSLY